MCTCLVFCTQQCMYSLYFYVCMCEKLGYVSRGGDWLRHVAEETLASAFSARSDVK